MPTLPRRCLTTIFVFIVMITTGCTSSNNVRLTKSVGGDLAVEFKKNSTFTKWKVCEALRYHVLDFDEFGRIAFPDNELDCYPPSRSNRCPDEPLDNRLSCRLEDIQRNIENKEAARVTLIVHGGLVSRSTGLSEAIASTLAMEAECKGATEPCQAYYPIFVVWRSGMLPTYFEQTTVIEQGERRPLFANIVAGVTFGTDLARGLARTLRFGASEGRRVWNTMIKPWYVGTEDPKMTCAGLADNSAQSDPNNAPDSRVFDENRIVCPTAENISQGWVKKSIGRTAYVAATPMRIITTPILLGPGQSAWENMRRRTRNIIWREAEGEDSFTTHDAVLPLLKGGLQYTVEKLLIPYPNREVTLIGHSMGTMVLTELLTQYPNLHFKNMVFMGAAVSLREFVYALKGSTAFQEKETNFYNLSLHPRIEAFALTGYGMLPSGTLLEWIDDAYHVPPTQLDRTLGKWVNLPALNHTVPEDVAEKMNFRMFGFSESEPQDHGDFNNVEMCYWRQSFWSGRDWQQHQENCRKFLLAEGIISR